jgi:hypothetical protein
MSKRGPEFAASTVAKRPATECTFYTIGLVSNQVMYLDELIFYPPTLVGVQKFTFFCIGGAKFSTQM